MMDLDLRACEVPPASHNTLWAFGQHTFPNITDWLTDGDYILGELRRFAKHRWTAAFPAYSAKPSHGELFEGAFDTATLTLVGTLFIFTLGLSSNGYWVTSFILLVRHVFYFAASQGACTPFYRWFCLEKGGSTESSSSSLDWGGGNASQCCGESVGQREVGAGSLSVQISGLSYICRPERQVAKPYQGQGLKARGFMS